MSKLQYFLQTVQEGVTPDSGGSMLSTLIMFGGILVLLYVFIILPQRRQQKKQQSMLKDLKVGDSVATIGGILGTVEDPSVQNKVGAEAVLLKTAGGSLHVEKQAISKVLTEQDATKGKGKQVATDSGKNKASPFGKQV